MTSHHDQVSITTQEQATGHEPKWRSLVWRGGRTVATDVPYDRITRELDADPDTQAWWFLPRDAAAVDKTTIAVNETTRAVEALPGRLAELIQSAYAASTQQYGGEEGAAGVMLAAAGGGNSSSGIPSL